MGRSYSKLRPEVIDDLTRLTGYTAQELHQKYSEFLTFHPSGAFSIPFWKVLLLSELISFFEKYIAKNTQQSDIN